MSQKIIDKINVKIAEGTTFFSFEYFPPKTDDGVRNLGERQHRMVELGPTFCDITWGAGGSTADLTLDIASRMQNDVGMETMMHLTCTNMPVEKLEEALNKCKEYGIRNILALRGDPPHGQDKFTQARGEEQQHCRMKRNYWADIAYLKEKVEAGADFVITQLFYEVGAPMRRPDAAHTDAQARGRGFKRMTAFCKTHVPKHIADTLEAIKDNDEAVKVGGALGAVSVGWVLKAGSAEVGLRQSAMP
eukprot:scaffold11.g3942.t1